MSDDLLRIELNIPDSLKRALDPDNFEKVAEAITDEAVTEIYPLTIAYPAEGSWNTPGPYPKRWYQRKKGPRWARVGGTVGGRNTSEQMQEQWHTVRPAFNEVNIYNTASYSKYVIGDEQASFHKDHGWLKVSDIAEKYLPRLRDVADRVLRRLFNG